MDTVRDLDVRTVDMGRNAGFAAGCNAGVALGDAPAILFLNPDARMTPEALQTLTETLDRHPECAAVGPRLVGVRGETQFSLRRAPRVRSAFGEALFLHRVLPSAAWSSEIVRTGYDTAQEVEWLIGAALLVRRAAFEEIGGFDERLFMYSEDADLCARLRDRGYTLRYEPSAVVSHEGAASAPRPAQAPVLASARIAYARLHERGVRYLAFRIAFALEELLRLPVAMCRSGFHLRARAHAFRIAVAPGAPWVTER